MSVARMFLERRSTSKIVGSLLLEADISRRSVSREVNEVIVFFWKGHNDDDTLNFQNLPADQCEKRLVFPLPQCLEDQTTDWLSGPVLISFDGFEMA